MKKLLRIFIFLGIFYCTSVYSEVPRIAILPFQNMDGKMEYNIISYDLQDSLTKVFIQADPEEKYYRVVPSDSVELLLSDLNIDPTNPQYPSDLWKVIRLLNVKYVITGNFNMEAKRILINAYIYNVRTKLPLKDHQARDIFKPIENYFEAIPIISETLLKAFIKED